MIFAGFIILVVFAAAIVFFPARVNLDVLNQNAKTVRNYQEKAVIKKKIPLIKISKTKPIVLPQAKPTQQIVEIKTNNPTQAPEEWGKAVQVSEHTWTMKIGFDDKMATSEEIFEALNSYRRLHKKNTLAWDENLAQYALSRAKQFTLLGNLDEHAGFAEFVKSEDNVRSLGFWALGENSSYGYQLNGTHLIEWIYAGDEPHNNNQLSNDWTHVGIGVDGNQTNLIFAGSKI